MAKTTFRLPKSLLKDIKHYAVDHDMSDTDVFNQALKHWMKQHYDKLEGKEEEK